MSVKVLLFTIYNFEFLQTSLAEMDAQTVVGHNHLTTRNISYNAFDEKVLFTGVIQGNMFTRSIQSHYFLGLSKCCPVLQPMELASLFLSMHGADK